MKRDWPSVPMPPRLAARPRDRRGYPIPYSVLITPNGEPDFRVTDLTRLQKITAHYQCGLCGHQMGRYLAFIGGPLSHLNRMFTDPPMHAECALYALQVCPYLAMPNMHHARNPHTHDGVVMATVQEVSTDRPAAFCLATTRHFVLRALTSGTPVFHADPWVQTRWFRDGEEIAQP